MRVHSCGSWTIHFLFLGKRSRCWKPQGFVNLGRGAPARSQHNRNLFTCMAIKTDVGVVRFAWILAGCYHCDRHNSLTYSCRPRCNMQLTSVDHNRSLRRSKRNDRQRDGGVDMTVPRREPKGKKAIVVFSFMFPPVCPCFRRSPVFSGFAGYGVYPTR